MEELFSLLFLISFLGLLIGLVKPSLVIRWGKLKGRKQVFLYFGISMIVFLIFMGVFADIEKQSGIQITDNTKNISSKTDYEIKQIQDLSHNNVIRYSYHVVVFGQPTSEQIKIISREIINKAKNNKKFNAISVSLYDYEEYINHGYTLGKVTYALNGNWRNAEKVITGDYDVMNYSYDIRNKNWEKQLTQQEVKVWKYYQNYNREKEMEEEDIYELAAIKYNLNKEEVKNIIIRQVFWANNHVK